MKPGWSYAAAGPLRSLSALEADQQNRGVVGEFITLCTTHRLHGEPRAARPSDRTEGRTGKSWAKRGDSLVVIRW